MDWCLFNYSICSFSIYGIPTMCQTFSGIMRSLNLDEKQIAFLFLLNSKWKLAFLFILNVGNKLQWYLQDLWLYYTDLLISWYRYFISPYTHNYCRCFRIWFMIFTTLELWVITVPTRSWVLQRKLEDSAFIDGHI